MLTIQREKGERDTLEMCGCTIGVTIRVPPKGGSKKKVPTRAYKWPISTSADA